MKILTPEQYPGLPKWPMAFVTGTSVTPEQAKEIIFRTDTCLHSISPYGFGNDHNFRAKCIRDFGWSPVIARQETWYSRSKAEIEADTASDVVSPWDYCSRYAEAIGIVQTEYVTNSWLATSYIGGPHGWCHPDGTILSDGHNYGKWPSVVEIAADWRRLQEAFPFLDVVCTLYSGEQCEDEAVPVVTIVVKNGEVLVIEPDLSLHTSQTTKNDETTEDDFAHIYAMIQGDYSGERGWPEGWLEEFAEKSRAAMQKLLHEPTEL